MPVRPITHQSKAESAKKEPSPTLLGLVDVISDPTLILNRGGVVCWRNPSFKRHTQMLGLAKDSDKELSLRLQASLTSANLMCHFPVHKQHFQGTASLVDSYNNKHSFRIIGGIFHGFALAIFDHKDDNSILRSVLDCIPSRVFWKDNKGNFLGGNHLFSSDCGVSNGESLLGKNDYDFFPKKDSKAYRDDDLEVMLSKKSKLNIEEAQLKSNGDMTWLLTNKVPMLNKAKDAIGVMGAYTDITEQKKHQQLIEKQARFDQLTGTYNRQALKDQFLKRKSSQKLKLGCFLFIDLDNFKTVNDTSGHAVGDKLLQLVAQRIANIPDKNDFLARLGSDQFGVISYLDIDTASTNTNKNSLTKYRKELQDASSKVARDIKNTILKPYNVNSHYIRLGVSIGITYFTSHESDWENTLNEADMAMNKAKHSGKNTICVFDESIRENINKMHHMRSLLNDAIEKNELYLKIQPQYGSTGHIIGAEALLRWNSNELGEISPVEFIPIIEQSGAIHTIGLWVFEESFKLVHEWLESYDEHTLPPLAINVSAKQFQSNDFLSNVQLLLQKHPIPPHLIHFELTESLLVESQDDAIGKLKALSNLGFPLAIDDFGTGYSCLSYLNQLPIDKIKIDKSFTFKITTDKKQAALVDTIITMAKNLDMNVLAEGVETPEQLEFLKEHGCHEYQGYFFSKPIDIIEYQRLLKHDKN